MRKNTKTLKFKKFKIANLDTFVLRGGTNDNTYVVTPPHTAETDSCPTIINTQCTIGEAKTDAENTCSAESDGFNDGP
ncbi:MAG: hypothetical protein AB8B65_03990 [Kordia sp.]|uniref:hypothetical protein n=1 Tax=Kordia sp. TaxID=1965332 RepID=UPI00385A8DA3